MGQTCEPPQMHPEKWEAGRQQSSHTAMHPRRLCLTGRGSSSAAAASSLAQPYLLHASFSPRCKLRSKAKHHHLPWHPCTLSSPASKPFSLSFFFSIFPHFVAAQFTSPKAHHEGSSLLPLSLCPLLPSPEGLVPPSPQLGLAALGLLYRAHISSCPLS